MNVIRIALSLLFISMCILATPVLSAGLEFPTHMQFMLKNLRDNAQANTLPVITQDHITLDEDQGSVLDLLSNDLDPDQDPLRIVSVSAKYGQVTLMPDGQIKYEPPAHFSGQDDITYLLYDGRANPVKGLAKITVNSVNDAPVANDDAVTLIANTQLDIDVLNNDSDIDGDVLTITQVTAQHGTVQVNNGNIQYRPYAEYDGSDVINYTIQDAANVSASAKVLVTVLKENKTAPVITGQKPLVMDEDTSFELDINQITYIDVDSLATDITFEVADGQYYTLDGFTLKPAKHFNGELTVPVTLFDGKHRSMAYHLKLTVNEVNDFPEAGQILWESVKNEKFALYMRGMMHDPDFNYWPLGRNDPRLNQYKFIFSKNARREDHGGWTHAGGRFVQVPGARSDLYEYTPPANFVGRDYVFFFVYDEQGAPSGRGDIVIDIKNHKDAPVILRHYDIAQVREDIPFSLSVNDLYIRYKGSTNRNGELSLVVQDMAGFYSFDQSTGLITIDPMYEEETLNVLVQVSDGATTSNRFRVAVPLTQVNEAPVLFDLDATVSDPKAGLTIQFRTGMMIDPEAQQNPALLDRFTYHFMSKNGNSQSRTTHGRLERVPGQPHGVFRYIPDEYFEGTDTVYFWVTDEQGLQSERGEIRYHVKNAKRRVKLKAPQLYQVK
ncbi:cadherin-like domain-containing protein [Pseudoalteromonas rubra]|uniref:cadherin-like domain-containing protein n=1 Tax=Pseudoalteromonas rubra TaxID=43658 RepID=UPI000F76B704|nr:cadherin-like domain-containing protein [Pseudoalteromonas rubra]